MRLSQAPRATRAGLVLALAAGTFGTLFSTTVSAKEAESNPAVERAAYLSAADKICAASNDRLVEAAKKYEKHLVIIRKGASNKSRNVAKPAEVAAFVTKVAVGELGSQFDQLDRLVPPGTDQSTVRAFLKDGRAILAKVSAKPLEAAYTNPFNKLGKKMKQFGFTACGQAVKT
jgi:hypothetical protein